MGFGSQSPAFDLFNNLFMTERALLIAINGYVPDFLAHLVSFTWGRLLKGAGIRCPRTDRLYLA